MFDVSSAYLNDFILAHNTFECATLSNRIMMACQ